MEQSQTDENVKQEQKESKSKKSRKKKGASSKASIQPTVAPIDNDKNTGIGSKIALSLKREFAPKTVRKKTIVTDEEKSIAKKSKSERSTGLGSKISGKFSKIFSKSAKNKDTSKVASASKIKGRRWWSYKETDDRILSAKVKPDEPEEVEDDSIKRRKMPEPRLVTGVPVERPTGLDPYIARQKKNQTVAIQPEPIKEVQKPKEEKKQVEISDHEEEVKEDEEPIEEQVPEQPESNLANIKLPIIVYRDPMQDSGNVHALRGTEIPPEKIRPEEEYVIRGGKVDGGYMSTVMRGGRIQAIYKCEKDDDFRPTQRLGVLSTTRKRPEDVTRRGKRKELEDLQKEDTDWDTLSKFLGDEAKQRKPPPTRKVSSSPSSTSEQVKPTPSKLSASIKPTRSQIGKPHKAKLTEPSPSLFTVTVSEAVLPKHSRLEKQKPKRAEVVKPARSQVSVTPSRTAMPTYSQLETPQKARVVEPSPSQVAFSPSRTVIPNYSQLEMPQRATLVEPSPSQIAFSPSRTVMPTYSQLDVPQRAAFVEPSPSQVALSPTHTTKPIYSQMEIPQRATLVESSSSEVSLSEVSQSPPSEIMPIYSQLELPQRVTLVEPSPTQVTLSPPQTTKPIYSQLEMPQEAKLESEESLISTLISTETTISSEELTVSESEIAQPPTTVKTEIAKPPTKVRSETIQPPPTTITNLPPTQPPRVAPTHGTCCHHRCMRPCAPCPPPIAFSYSFSSGMPCNYHRQECASTCLKEASCTSPCLPNIPCPPCVPSGPCPPCMPSAPCTSPCYYNTPCCQTTLPQYPNGHWLTEGMPPESNISETLPPASVVSKTVSVPPKSGFFSKRSRTTGNRLRPSPKEKKKGFFDFF